MTDFTTTSIPIRFGPFEVWPDTKELRKNGTRLRLPTQAIEILLILVRNPGRVTTREELKQTLWPDASFGDFDHGLNVAVNRLREALRDSADSPKFVETIPRHGYRFVGSIKQGLVSAVRQEPVVAIPPSRIMTPANWQKWSVGLAVIGIAGLAVLIPLVSPSRPPLAQIPRVLGYTQLTHDALAKVVPQFPWSFQLVTNGPRIYFSQVATNLDSRAFAEIPSSGAADGSTSSIRASFDFPTPTGISPDGSQLLAASGAWQWDRPLWLISLPSGTSRRLGDLIGHDASWSPAGRTIVFAEGHELYRTDIAGSTVEKLTTLTPGVATFIRWSPDGRQLRFTVTDSIAFSRSSSLWQVSSDGTGLRRLFPAWGGSHPEECCGNWTADGKYFVFQATRAGSTGIWAAREEMLSSPSSNPVPVQLTSGPIRFTAPLPSKDGKQIFAIGEQLRGELQRFDLKSQRFVPYLSGISAEQLDFSRDGQWVTYTTYPELVLWRSRIDGTQRQQLTVPPLEGGEPRWSPDGKQIAFSGHMPGERLHLYVIPAEGGTPKAVTPASANQPNQGSPNWSPDGNSLIFFEVDDYEGGIGSRVLRLDLRTRQVSVLPSAVNLYIPRLSPDGHYVVARDNNRNKMMLFDFRLQQWSELVTGSNPFLPEWTSDSKHVFYIDVDRLAYCRVNVCDRKVERVADLGQTRGVSAGHMGIYYGVTPEGSPLFLRNTGIQEIYALDVDLP